MKSIINKIKDIGLRRILMMNLGMICCAIASVIFISPAKLVAGGSTGLSVFLGMLTNVHYYFFMYGINAILIVVSFFLLGKDFTIKTIFGSIMLPTYGFLVSELCELINFDILKTISEVEAPFVVLFAAILMGFGVGINLKNGGSTGGFDILETIMNKYLHISYSASMYMLDAVLIVLGMIFFDSGVEYKVFANGFSEGLGAAVYILTRAEALLVSWLE